MHFNFLCVSKIFIICFGIDLDLDLDICLDKPSSESRSPFK